MMEILNLALWGYYFIVFAGANYGSLPTAATGDTAYQQDLRNFRFKFITSEDTTVQAGLPFFVSCHPTGSDVSDIYWTRPDGRRVERDQKGNVYSSHENGQLLLLILEAHKANEGDYVCLEITDRGRRNIANRFTLHVSESHPRFEEPYELVEITEGENATLVCKALGEEPIRYTWLDQHGLEITETSPNPVIIRRQNNSETYSELYVLGVRNETKGVYACIASNNLGRSTKLFELVVQEFVGLRPSFNESTEEVYGEEFKSLTLTCIADGKPAPTYRWFDQYQEELHRNHSRVVDSNKTNYNSIIITETSKYGQLSFVRLNQSDRGNYTCLAENRLGAARKVYLVYVNEPRGEYPPFFNETRAEVHSLEAEQLVLNCEANGNPKPKYTWYDMNGTELNRYHHRVIDLDYLNDTAVIPDRRSSAILVSPSNGTLIFVAIKVEDAGNYTCYARNSKGQASKTYDVYVDKTEVPDDHVVASVQNVTDTSVTFQIFSRTPSLVGGFQAQYRLVDKQLRNLIRWSVGEDYTVKGLLSGGKYYFEFATFSGRNWTDALTVALPPGPPEVILRQVAPYKVNMEFFRPWYLYTYNAIDYYIIKYRTVRQVGGETWSYGSCEVTIKLPKCFGYLYEISNLGSEIYYSITVQAVGPGGAGEPSERKVFIR